jgi:type VI protein secretion system component VasF
VSSTTGGENSVVQMLGSLYDSIENDYGAFPTRLYRAFRPKSGDHAKDLFMPYVLFLLLILFIVVMVMLLFLSHIEEVMMV